MTSTPRRRFLVVLAWALFTVGCQEVRSPVSPAAPVAPKSAPRIAPSAAPVAAAPVEPVAQRAFRLAWTLQTTPFNQGLALSDRHVAVLGTRHLSLVDMRSGQVLGQREICPTFPGAFAFVSNDLGAIVCEQSVQLVAVPTLADKASHPLPGRARVAAFSRTHAAIAFEAGPVRTYDIASWSLQEQLDVPDEVRSLAMSRDGRLLAIGLDQGDVLLVNRRDPSTKRLTVKMGLAVETLQFDATGARLLVTAGPSTALWDPLAGTVVHRFRGVSNVFAAGFVDGASVASAGRDGLLLLDVATDTASSLAGGLDGTESAVALVVTDDGKVLCAAERDGMMACYARGRIPARGVVAGNYGADDMRMAGRVLGLVTDTPGIRRLTVKAEPHAELPEPGTEVRVFRYTEATIGTARSARWIEVVTARVVKLEERIVHLSVEHPLTEVQGVSDPLVHDTPVRLGWKRPAEAPSP